MAAIDFPASPTNGQVFLAPNGVSYIWNATKGIWISQGSTFVAPSTFDLYGGGILINASVSNATVPQISDAGLTIFNRTFQANNPNNPIDVDCDVNFGAGGAAVNVWVSLFIDGGPSAVMSKTVTTNAQWFNPVHLRWRGVLSPGPHTFSIRVSGGGNFYLNRNDGVTPVLGGATYENLTITEIGVGQQGPPGPAGPPGAATNFLQRKYFPFTAQATGLAGTFPNNNSVPQNTSGNQVMTASITPISAASVLDITALIYGSQSTPGDVTIGALFRDAVVSAFGSAAKCFAQAGATGSMSDILTIRARVPSNATISTTFNCRVGGVSGGSQFNFNFQGTGALQYGGGTMASSITIDEVMP